MVVAMPPTTRRAGRRGRGSGRGSGEAAPEGAPVNVDMTAILAEMQAMHCRVKCSSSGS